MSLNDKVVLVTGGTGSFGQKFTEIVLREYRPRKLIIFSRDELKQHEMRRVFPDSGGSPVRYFIGDVRDPERLKRALHGVDIIIHAAALKQVPACEYNPFEAVLTNILGAKNVIDASIDQRVSKVLALSTDKAVNPVNLYGATKLCAEKLFIQGNAYAGEDGTRLACARYGNVVGSRGSVIPEFIEQSKNGTVTVTDPRMTRFWLTLEDGVKFVIRCLDVLHGGEIFLPKLPSMNIMDLVDVVAPGCKVEYIGIRPGEKLHEALISEDEVPQTVELDDMYIIKPLHPWWKVDNHYETQPVPKGSRFTSDANAWRLSRDELRRMIEWS